MPSKLRQTILKLLPWLVTALVLAYIGWSTDLTTAKKTLAATNWAGFMPVVLLVAFGVFFFDSWCLALIFRRFNAPVGYRELLPLKGASYFLNLINYNAAAAGIALFFRNKKKVPFLEALSTMLWLNFIDIVALATLMLAGLVFGGARIDPSYERTLFWLASGIYVILIGSCLYWNAGVNFLVLGRLRGLAIFTAFRRAHLVDYGRFITLRTTFVLTYVVSQWASMPFFDMHASFRELLTVVPVLTFVGTIPFTTVAGLGTVQVMMRELFADFAPAGAAQIDAYSTTSILALVAWRIVIGYVSMGMMMRDAQGEATVHSEPTTDTVK